MLKRVFVLTLIIAVAGAALFVSGCGVDEETMRRIAREEIQKDRVEAMKAFAPETFGFGGALEKEWKHAQGVKTGNMIFVSGQQPYDTNLDDKGMPLTDLETGRNFQQQLRTVFENIEKVLKNYGATMDDVVFLQCFVDAKAGKNEATFEGAPAVIKDFFPNALQSMTFVMVENLFGPEQLIEANAIAVVHK